MSNNEDKYERRMYKRYKVGESVFAALPTHYLVAKIKNISRGGIAFLCFANEEQGFDRPKMEIFSKDNDFFLRDVPLKVVSEIKLENQVPFSSLQMNQISGEFGELTENQISQLECFIQKFAVAET